MKSSLNHKILLTLCAALALPLSVAQSAVIVNYTFQSQTAVATVGSSISSLTTPGTGGINTPYSTWTTGTEAGQYLVTVNGSSGAGRSIDISLNATGYQDVTLGSFFQLRASNTTAATTWQLSYSINGGSSFTQIGANFAIINTGGGNSESTRITNGANFALPVGANNNANIIFRINSAPGSLNFLGVIADGGQVGFDNFSINASVIPEPSTWALLVGGMTALVVLRRRRKC